MRTTSTLHLQLQPVVTSTSTSTGCLFVFFQVRQKENDDKSTTSTKLLQLVVFSCLLEVFFFIVRTKHIIQPAHEARGPEGPARRER